MVKAAEDLLWQKGSSRTGEDDWGTGKEDRRATLIDRAQSLEQAGEESHGQRDGNPGN